MKKIIFAFATAALLIACNGNDDDIKTVPIGAAFTLKVNQTAEIETNGMKITLLEITDDSRCPNNVECFWEGRVLAEFRVTLEDEEVIRTLTDNPSGDPGLSSEFEAFGHLVKLVEVTPYPETTAAIPQKDYRVNIEVEE
jgi:hypothetical protein